jgi:hypothetical protein
MPGDRLSNEQTRGTVRQQPAAGLVKRPFLLAPVVLSLVAAPAAMAQGEAFGVNLRGTVNLRQFPANDPSQMGNIVGATISTYAMDFNTAGTLLYAVRNTDGSNLNLTFGTIDTSTGGFSPIADVTGLPVDAVPTGLSVDPTTETIYLSTAWELFTLNPVTGAATLIGDFGADLGIMIDIAVDNNGNMYGHNSGADALFSIDKTTGLATQIGLSHGMNANFAQGMDFDPTTNTLYAAIYISGGQGHYVSWDTTTGEVTVLADTLPFDVEMELAIRVPAPGALALVGLGGLVAVRRRRPAGLVRQTNP